MRQKQWRIIGEKQAEKQAGLGASLIAEYVVKIYIQVVYISVLPRRRESWLSPA